MYWNNTKCEELASAKSESEDNSHAESRTTRDLNLPQSLVKHFILFPFFLNMLLIRSKVLRLSQGFSLLRSRAIRALHTSRLQSMEWSRRMHEHHPDGQEPTEAKTMRRSSAVHEEGALTSQEGHTRLVSYGTQNDLRPDCKLVARGIRSANDLWPRLLRYRNDAPIRPAIRPGHFSEPHRTNTTF